MSRAILSPDARQDIDDIADYIARDSLNAAIRWLDDLDQFLYRVSQIPGIGTSRDELIAGLRSVPFGQYVVFFRRTRGGVEIIRVLHGSRDLPQFFQP